MHGLENILMLIVVLRPLPPPARRLSGALWLCSGTEDGGLIIPENIGDMWDAQYAAGAR